MEWTSEWMEPERWGSKEISGALRTLLEYDVRQELKQVGSGPAHNPNIRISNSQRLLTKQGLRFLDSSYTKVVSADKKDGKVYLQAEPAKAASLHHFFEPTF